MKKAEIRVGINTILINELEQILLGKRLSGEGAGTWGLPGGHLELGETFTEAATRELFEETGLVLEEPVFLSVINEPSEDNHYIQINFVSNKWGGEVALKEPKKCAEWKWWPINSLPLELFWAHEPVLSSFRKGFIYKEVIKQ